MSNNVIVIGASEVAETLKNKEAEIIEIVKETYVLHHNGKTSLPQSSFLRFPDDNKNRIIGLPAYIGGQSKIAGIKWISSFPENIKHGVERASAAIFLNGMEDGRVKAILEGSIISAKRTAASAALAAGLMHGNVDEDKVGLVGCGRINSEILRFLKNVFTNLKKVYLFDISVERMEKFSKDNLEDDFEYIFCDSIEDLFSQTTLISFATTAGTPYIHSLKGLTESHTILGISLRDIAPDIVKNTYNIVDDLEHVCRENTSIHLTYKELGNTDFVAGNIADLVNKKIDKRAKGKAALYSPFGLGVLDLALSKYVYTKSMENNTGIIINDFFS